SPPTTWTELSKVARKVMKDTGTRYGFVFQGAQYEGGTANAAEFIWSAGGELVSRQLMVTGFVVSGISEADSVEIGSAASARGLDIARKLITDNVTPAAVATFRERQGLDAFLAGDAVFLRSWPSAYGVLRQAGFTLDQFGIAPLPAAADGGRSASCLGGWNLMINDRSSKSEQKAAWKFIQYLTAADQQKKQARGAALLPVLGALYDDPGLAEEVPVIGLGKQVFTSRLHARPTTPFYGKMSMAISREFNRVLKGEASGTEAVQVLQKELSEIVVRNR
ncbi:MAG: extracellular solute-binding protein, partial [Myxococcota bacterium]